jgi:formylglycine-generating enzyme required for sulfatase activity
MYKDFEVDAPVGTPPDVRELLKTADPRTYATLPAVGLSWFAADLVARARSGPVVQYRLPTEAEWERAARGGLPDARYPWGDAEPTPRLADYDRFDAFSIRPPREFGSNGYGLVAMAGTVSEWCSDWYDALEYEQPAARNPTGPAEGKVRVARGGSWADCPSALRVSFRAAHNPARNFVTPTLGMRPVRSVRG